MANPNKAFGFKPVKTITGADWDGRGNTYWISKSNTDVIRVGDPVTKDMAIATAIDTKYGTLPIKLAGSTAQIVGVVVAVGATRTGPYADPMDLTKNYAPATKSKDYWALVCDDPNVIYEIQEEKGTLQIAGSYIGCNQIFVADTPATTLAAGQTISGYQLACTTTGAPAATTFDVKLLGLAQRSDNTYGAYAKWLVKLTQPMMGTTAGFAIQS